MSQTVRSSTITPKGMGIGELTNVLQAQNQVKECPELTTLKQKYHSNLDILERKIVDMAERMQEEITKYVESEKENLRQKEEVADLESRIQVETELIAEVTEARRVLHRVDTLEQDNRFLRDTVDGLKLQLEQDDTDRILKAQQFAAREENREQHEDIDKTAEVLKVERQKLLIMEDVTNGAEARARAAEARVRELEKRVQDLGEELSESRGLFLHGAHMDFVAKKKAGPVVTDSGGFVLANHAQSVEMSKNDPETQKKLAQARIASYKAKQASTAKVHANWKAPVVPETVKERAVYLNRDAGNLEAARPKTAVVRRGRAPIVKPAENEHITYFDANGRRISEVEARSKSSIRSMQNHAILGGVGTNVA